MLRSGAGIRVALLAIVGVALVAGALTRAASARQSATFDEIILVSGGARGVTLGRWDMVTDQPPLMMWLYGWAVSSADPVLPTEDRSWGFDERWDYARAVFFEGANDPEVLLPRARLVTTVMAAGLVFAAGLFGLWVAGPVSGVLAALFTALVPDVLAHGGVAYNDVPLALAFLLSVWALDATVRRPSLRSGALTGVALACAFGMKMSALALLPIAGVLLGMEATSRWGEEAWRRRVVASAGAGMAAAYLTLVVFYGGDVTLSLLRFNFWRTVLHTTGGHPAPAFLLGSVSEGGWWYYFPVAFFLKTPVGLHIALVTAVTLLASSAVTALRTHREAALAQVMAWRGRAPLVGALVFGAFLMRSDLNAGFRYALPAVSLLAVFTAIGASRAWRTRGGAAGDSSADALGDSPRGMSTGRGRSAVRVVVVVAVILSALSVLRTHPWHLSYASAWAGGPTAAWRALSDSNVDWGQGLLELRRFMQDEGVASVRLSYFGSARPSAYGIEYVALPSFFRLTRDRTSGSEADPRFTVISATNLQGLYLQGRDPFASYREREPYRILGHALFVYDDTAR
ncbi:MAG: ArnT family glycosyltransferase [Longimicrobiales bacterium]